MEKFRIAGSRLLLRGQALNLGVGGKVSGIFS